MKKCILILTICILTASAAYADFYTYGNQGNTDYYMQLNRDTYYSTSSGTTYMKNGDDINGTDGSWYRQDDNMIYDMQSGDMYYNNNGYIQKF